MAIPGGSWLIDPVGTHEQFTGADFSDDDLLYARTAEEFVRHEVLTRLDEIESKKEGVMPAVLKRAGALGLLMIDVPQAYGGLGLKKTTSMLVSERGALCASFSVSWGAHTGIGTLPLVYYGTEAQKQRYLPKLATGEWLAGYALTEPGSGSDALGARAQAVREPDGAYRLTGTKQFITNAGFADLFTVFAKVDGDKFTAFLVERDTPGLSTGPEEKKLGIRGSSTRQLILDGARVPAENVLGQIGQGHKIAFNILNIGRFKLGAGAGGAAKECLQVALDYARDRKQFGQPIASFGMVQLADMATDLRGRQRYPAAAGRGSRGDRSGTSGAGSAWCAESVEYTLERRSEISAPRRSISSPTRRCGCSAAAARRGVPGRAPLSRLRINASSKAPTRSTGSSSPAVKRIGTGALRPRLLQRVTAVHRAARPRRRGPLGREVAVAERAKRLVAYTARVMMERDLASLKSKQQHLEIFANMIIEIFAMDSVVNRTRLLLARGPDDATALRVAMTNVYVASANERVADGARRLLANELDGEELQTHVTNVNALALDFPIRTIIAKTHIAEALVAAGVGPVFLRDPVA